MRLLSAAVPEQVDTDDAAPRLLEQVGPARVAPAMLERGPEAVDQQDRRRSHEDVRLTAAERDPSERTG
jgi:hypothetical protein